ncbi:MAG: ACT domain-containing protein [Oscillospiraceae bacterium]|nr:ACT domain-containing protein [Oscillospiraceae bacterium]
MFITQVSVFIENDPGRLSEITGVLARENIDIRALSIADTSDFGILRLIVNEPDKAITVLQGAGITARKTPVIAVRLKDSPGGLHAVLSLLSNVEYVYAFVSRGENDAYVVIRCENSEKAVEILKNNDVKLLTDAEIFE